MDKKDPIKKGQSIFMEMEAIFEEKGKDILEIEFECPMCFGKAAAYRSYFPNLDGIDYHFRAQCKTCDITLRN